jgi:ferric-dicitrate binding protein FerR (iron transport regulator)
MSEHLSDMQIDQLIADYLAGSLSDSDRPAFEAWLRASPEHPRRVARLSMTDFCIREVCQDTKSDYLLDVLNQIDDAAGPAQLVTLHNFQQPIWHRYRIHAVWGAIAAALLLGVVLTTVLLTGSDPSTPPSITDNTQPKPAESAQPILRDQTATPVATLTATHNAVWASPQAEGASAPGSLRSLTPGSKLHPNTRLTLAAGFAEITTAQGAVLQAPATIELTDNDNALHLHAGKLVGICETESSKGFVVRTPHMDITDLGTRFGVDASRDGTTQVHVIDGKVEAVMQASFDGPAVTQYLTAGQAVQAYRQSDQFEPIAIDSTRFVFEMPGDTDLSPPIAAGSIAWSELPPTQLRASDDLQVFVEKKGLTLPEDVTADYRQGDRWPGSRPKGGVTIQRGTVADVYLLYLKKPGGEPYTGQYTVEFERPILGVITSNRNLDATDRLFAGSLDVNVRGRAALEEPAEKLAFSEDGTALHLTLRVGDTPDQLRVLVVPKADR